MVGFNEIIGHEEIIRHLKNAMKTGKVSHSYIFTGRPGSGKKLLAATYAMTLQCEAGGTEPCQKCDSCKKALGKNHPDIIYVNHEKPGTISIDEIREQLISDVSIKPYCSPHKIYIIPDAEMMTVQAQNALLKTIEEPPSYAVILLLTTNPDAFLPTILSRCVQLKLKPLKDSVVKEYLIQSLGVEESQAEIYAAFARGNLGRAIHLAQSEDFKRMYGVMLTLLKSVKEADISQLLDYVRTFKEEGFDIHECLDFMQMWYRDVLMYKTTKDINLLIFKDQFPAIKEMCTASGYDGLERILAAIDKAGIRLDANVNTELVMELLFLSMKEN